MRVAMLSAHSCSVHLSRPYSIVAEWCVLRMALC